MFVYSSKFLDLDLFPGLKVIQDFSDKTAALSVFQEMFASHADCKLVSASAEIELGKVEALLINF